jgi:hypothetical protein
MAGFVSRPSVNKGSEPFDLLRGFVDDCRYCVNGFHTGLSCSQLVHQHGAQVTHRAADRCAVKALAHSG